MSDEKVVLDHDDLRRTLVRIAHEIVEKNEDSDRLALVGIHRRGAMIATRIHALVEELIGAPVPLGDLDISFYRDDVAMRGPDRQLHALGTAIVEERLDRGADGAAGVEDVVDEDDGAVGEVEVDVGGVDDRLLGGRLGADVVAVEGDVEVPDR